MRKITFATVVSSALAALAIGLAGPALADDAGGFGCAGARRPCRRVPDNAQRRRGESVHALRRRPVRPLRRVGPALNNYKFSKTGRPAFLSGGIFFGLFTGGWPSR